MKIAVLGGGNGSLAAAGDLALAGHEVRLWRRDRAAVEAHRAAGGLITVKDFRGRHEARPALITADIGRWPCGMPQLIVCPAPATAQADIARELAPHLADGQVVFLPPGTFGSVLFAKAAWDAGNRARVAFAETGTLPWLTRKHGRLRGGDHHPRQAAADGRVPADACRRTRWRPSARAFPGVIEPCGDALSGALMNAGPIIHPPLITMNAAPLEHFEQLGHPQGRHAASDPPRHRRARCRAHGHPRGAGLRPAALPARQPLCARGRGMDVRPRLARQAHRLRRLARAHRADRAPLHAGGCAHRAVVPRLGRRAGRRGDAAGARIPRHRLGHLRRGFHGDRPHAGEPGSRPSRRRRVCKPLLAEGFK